MAVMAAISIADGATSPVTHVYNPVTDSPPEWVDSDAAVVYKHLQKRIIIDIKRAKTASGINRVKVQLTLPTGGDGVSVPANEVSRFAVANLEFLLPAKGSKQERKDIRTLVKNSLADAQLIDVIDELNSAW